MNESYVAKFLKIQCCELKTDAMKVVFIKILQIFTINVMFERPGKDWATIDYHVRG